MKNSQFCFVSDKYFEKFSNETLMRNKERIDGTLSSRPCFFVFNDLKCKEIYWIVPISKKYAKYKAIHDKNVNKYGVCNTIRFGEVAGAKAAFLIQNMCPITSKYIDEIYIDKTGSAVEIDNRTAADVISNAKIVLAKVARGKKLVFANIFGIRDVLLKELKESQPQITLSADKYAPVAINRLLPLMNEKMRASFADLPFVPTHAIIALFEGQIFISERGGDYSKNKQTLTEDCERLKARYPEYSFKPQSNAWPLPAVNAARLAGLGIIGLNGLLYTPEFGFSHSIGAVLTDAPLADGIELKDGEGYCPKCMKCVEACPGFAISYAGNVRKFTKEKCLSYLRQHEKTLPLEREGYHGCDICRDVCPLAGMGQSSIS